jgi:Anti-sigma factor NepR
MSTKVNRLEGYGGSDLGSDEAMEGRGFDRWLNRQLHRHYDPVLGEPVPDEMMRLLTQFDPRPQAEAESKVDGGGQKLTLPRSSPRRISP